MSSSVQQLSVSSEDRETFLKPTPESAHLTSHIFSTCHRRAIAQAALRGTNTHDHSLSAYSAQSLRCGSGPGAALCLPS